MGANNSTLNIDDFLHSTSYPYTLQVLEYYGDKDGERSNRYLEEWQTLSNAMNGLSYDSVERIELYKQRDILKRPIPSITIDDLLTRNGKIFKNHVLTKDEESVLDYDIDRLLGAYFPILGKGTQSLSI